MCAQPVPLAGDREELAEGESEHQGRDVLHVVDRVVCILGRGFLESCAWSISCSSSEEANSTKPSVSASCQHTQSCNNVGQVGG